MTLRESALRSHDTAFDAHGRGRDLDALVIQLSSHLIDLPAGKVDAGAETALRQLGETLGIDRVSFVLHAREGAATESALSWQSGGASTGLAEEQNTLPWYRDRIQRGESVVLDRLPYDLPLDAVKELLFVKQIGLKSSLTIPVSVASRKVGVLSAASFRQYCSWSPAIVSRLKLISEILGSALYRRQQDDLLSATARDAQATGAFPPHVSREDLDGRNGFAEIVGASPALKASLERVLEVASTDATVLLLGDTGTGKELFARALHDRSSRRRHALVRVNCAALPATLIESELFGHERGAFTGAAMMRQGRFELADKGTVFLDEIGDLPLEVQVKLLRVLQEREFERLGSSHTRKVDVRLIAATNCDLEKLTAEGRFRADLFYRLNVFPIRVPSLSERREDIPRLVWFFIHQRQRALGRRITEVTAETMKKLQEYDWPGNVRELENVIERAMIRSQGSELIIHDALVPETRMRTAAGTASEAPVNALALEVIERRHIEGVLQRCRWRINGGGNAAERLGLHPNTLRFRMKKLGIERPRPQPGS